MTDEQEKALRTASGILCGMGYYDQAETINGMLAAGAIRGPLTDDQRQRAIALYMNLPHSWASAISVINDASTSGYTNGVLDAAPPAKKDREPFIVGGLGAP